MFAYNVCTFAHKVYTFAYKVYTVACYVIIYRRRVKVFSNMLENSKVSGHLTMVSTVGQGWLRLASSLTGLGTVEATVSEINQRWPTVPLNRACVNGPYQATSPW